MNKPTLNTLDLVGRLLLVALFLPAGIGKLTGFSGTVGYIASVGLPAAHRGCRSGRRGRNRWWPGLAVRFGHPHRRPGAGRLHPGRELLFPRLLGGAGRPGLWQQLMFFKNVAVAGGLLTLAANGAGAWSLDAKRG